MREELGEHIALAWWTIRGGLEDLSNGGVISALYIKPSTHHLVQLLLLVVTDRKTVHLETETENILLYFQCFYVKYLLQAVSKLKILYYYSTLTPSKCV